MSEDGTVTGELVVRNTAGFWIVGAMSPFVLGGIGGLARERVKAERAREVSGDDADLRQVIVKQWGFPYSPRRSIGSVEAKDLVERCEPALELGKVAHGVRFLVLVVDVQRWGFDWLVRGFGVGGESWIVDRGRLAQHPTSGREVDPATTPEDWDLLLGLFERAYPLADGSGRVMKIRGMAYDSQGMPGVTTQAYEAFRRWRKAGKTRVLGKVGGREVWPIIPTKGATGLNAPRLIITYPDTGRKSNRDAGRGEVPTAQFNPNLFKDDLAAHLKAAMPGPWYVHFPPS
jgi:phage terminase large subunit GpA-like protein